MAMRRLIAAALRFALAHRCGAVSADWDHLVEQAHARWLGWQRPPRLRATKGGTKPSRIDIVVSVVKEQDLPRWAIDMARGEWSKAFGTRVHLVAYLRQPPNVTLLELAHRDKAHLQVEFLNGAHPKSRNVCTYSTHVEWHYDDLADVTLFTKTNSLNPIFLKQVLSCMMTRFDAVSHPWVHMSLRRRFIDVVCDKRWQKRTDLYKLVCPCERAWPYTRKGHRAGYDDLLVACDNDGPSHSAQARVTPAFKRFIAAEQGLEDPLFPLVFERYSEGIYAVAKSMLLQHNRSLWTVLNGECDAVGEEDHDTSLQNWALLISQREPWRQYSYPPWLASESVQLYVDDTRGVHRSEYACAPGLY